MLVRSASFVRSSTSLIQCPPSEKPEFGFIGRSNVGKSSLINLITGISRLAKTSVNPGKTKTINHFLINDSWYIADLPGYGFARVSLKMRESWTRTVKEYILKRENLLCLFVLLDSRLKPQNSDLEFMEFLGKNQVPFARVFTKSDKLSSTVLERSIGIYDKEMLKTWESMPPTFISSTVNRAGREKILEFIEETINNLSNKV